MSNGNGHAHGQGHVRIGEKIVISNKNSYSYKKSMFIAKNKVRMHDTDMAGLLYFARQFRYAHDALEDFMEHIGIPFEIVFHRSDYSFVIVHCEADYKAPLNVGDQLEVHLIVENVGQTSFTFFYEIFRNKELVGTVKTVHVTIDLKTREKISIPSKLREKLEAHTS